MYQAKTVSDGSVDALVIYRILRMTDGFASNDGSIFLSLAGPLQGEFLPSRRFTMPQTLQVLCDSLVCCIQMCFFLDS